MNETVLAALAAAWREHPNWRLGQLIVNACPEAVAAPGIFYLEDDEWLAAFETLDREVAS